MQLGCQLLRNALPAALGIILPLRLCKHFVCLLRSAAIVCSYLAICFFQKWCLSSSGMALHRNFFGFIINYPLHYDSNVPKMFKPYVPVLDVTQGFQTFME
jgi:hypothetical protein